MRNSTSHVIFASLWIVSQACGDGTQAPSADGETDANLAPVDAGAPVDAARIATPLIDHKGWRRYARELDPLVSHQPATIACSESAAFVEFDAYEVRTDACNYVLSEHPSLADVPAGRPINLTLLHYDLIAEAPAEAHLAIVFGDTVQWETTIPIPSSGKAFDLTFVSTRALALGEPIRLHLHNHGGNTWLLFTLEVLGPLAAP